MGFSIVTPTLLFSAISLLLLAYTNRFLAIANLTRQFIKLYQDNKNENELKQISHFKKRLQLIKYTQVFGVLSFLMCIICMFLIMMGNMSVAELVFGFSLLLMMISLIISLIEILISIKGLNIELEKIKAL
jgi:ABC-type bacteriocin/lantibiotic exporter with double-glycine peptidase domain